MCFRSVLMRGRSADPDNGDLLQAKIGHFGAADLADEVRDEEGSAHASPLLIPNGLALCILHEIDWRTVDFHIFHTSCMQFGRLSWKLITTTMTMTTYLQSVKHMGSTFRR